MLAATLAGALGPAARAEPMWTTYHRDAQRSGDDPEATQPIAPLLAWQSADLGAPIWGQPLVLGDRVYVATVGDEVYALEASTGKIVWQRTVGTPVPSDELPCGDIEPTVGVVGTPVIDMENGSFYVVADRWSTTDRQIKHVLVGLSLATGEEVLSTDVDPPGADPKALLQRTALNLDKGEVVFGYGGNDGDCSDYRGAVVAVPADGGPPSFWQYQPAPPSSSGGAVWATGGPAVDEAGNIYATTGNPDPPAGEEATVFDDSDSVLKINPSEDFSANPLSEPTKPLAWFEPPTWQQESNTDEDLGSAAPELLTGGLLFQAGKSATGYLIEEATMQSVYSGAVCSEKGGYGGSFGGDAFASGTIYIPCENGVQALAYSEAHKTFAPLWQGPSDAVGPPILSAGLVWTVATGGFEGGSTTLYGLDLATGVPRYTETLPSPVIDHFASPSAAGGRLFVASGSSVTAYQIAQLPPTPSGSTPGSTPSSTSPASGGVPASPKAIEPAAPILLRRNRLRMSRTGVVRLALRCTLEAGRCEGTVAVQAIVLVWQGKGKHRRLRSVLVPLASKHFGPARGDFGLMLRLGRVAIARLRRHHDRQELQITIASPGYAARHATAVLL